MKISVYVCVPTGKDVSDRWYNEVNQYNFNQPGFSSATGKSIYSKNVLKSEIEILTVCSASGRWMDGVFLK